MMTRVLPLFTWVLACGAAATAWAQAPATSDGTFPPEYLPEDFLLPFMQAGGGAASATEMATPSGKQPVTFTVQQLPRTVSDTTGRQPVPAASAVVANTYVLPAVETAAGDMDGDLWQGSSADTVTTLLNRLVAQGVTSSLARKVLQDLLLVGDSVPAGTSDVAWQAVRAELLLKMGWAEDAYRTVQDVAPEALAQHPQLAEAWTVAMLLAGKYDRACGYVKQQVLNTDAPFWRQAVLTCQAVQGEIKALELTLSLDGEADSPTNARLRTMVQALLDDSAVPAPTEPISSLQAVLYGAFPHLITAEVLPYLPDMMLRRVVNTEQLDKLLRVQAGERLVEQQGKAQDVRLLTKLYDSFEFAVADVKEPLEGAKRQEHAAVGRALLWQAAAMGQVTSHRAQALQALWGSAAAAGLTNLGSALLPGARNILPHPNLAWFAPDVVKAALQAGDMTTAESWWQVLALNQGLSAALSQQRAVLRLPMAFVQGDMTVETLHRWWQEQTSSTPVPYAYLQRVLAVLDALQVPVPLAYWQELYVMEPTGVPSAPVAEPDHIWLRLMAAQLEQQHRGGALLMLLGPLTKNSVDALSPQALGNIVTGFSFIGFEREARQLALQALLPAISSTLQAVDADAGTTAD